MFAQQQSSPKSHLKTVDPFESVPYANPSLEKSLLGAILRYPGQFTVSLGALMAGYRPPAFKLAAWECFYDKSCGWVYQGLTALHESGNQIDLPLLENWLIGNNPDRYSRPELGRPWLREIYDLGYASSAIEDASREILSAALRRWQESELQSTLELARDRSVSCEDYNATLGSKLLEVTYSRNGGGAKSLERIAEKWMAEYQDYRNTGAPTLISTGFKDLNTHMGGGYKRGDLIIVAGRSSMGKTSFAVSSLISTVMDGYSGLFFSLEQSEKAVFNQLVSWRSTIPSKLFSAPENLEKIERENPGLYRKLMASMQEVARLDLTIEDQRSPTIHDIKNTAVQWAAQANNPGLLCIDYLGLIRTSSKNSAERSMELGDFAAELRTLGGELNVPVVLLVQAKSVENRQDKRPMMADLAESDKVVRHADQIYFVYRDSYYNKELEAEIRRAGRLDEVELIAAKGRNEGTGTIYLNFHGPTRTFSDRDSGNSTYGDDY